MKNKIFLASMAGCFIIFCFKCYTRYRHGAIVEGLGFGLMGAFVVCAVGLQRFIGKRNPEIMRDPTTRAVYLWSAFMGAILGAGLAVMTLAEWVSSS